MISLTKLLPPALPFARVAIRDLLEISRAPVDFETHLEAAIDWLIRAHTRGSDTGVSYGYSLKGGWRPSYIETTGYIAETFYDLAKERNDSRYAERAIQMVEWLLTVQNENGSFSNPRYTNDGIVFDTGQDLFGLVLTMDETNDDRFRSAATRAGDWLSEIAADEQKRWTKFTHKGIPHVYNSRVAWALLMLNDRLPRERWEATARANLDWAVSEQQSSGLFDECAFDRGVAPFTHTIAYAIRGLWESGEILDDSRYRDSALNAAKTMTKHVRNDGFIPGQISPEGVPTKWYCCLTGNAQMAIVWGKMYRATGDTEFRHAATKALSYVMGRQNLTTSDQNRHGAIKGSHPVWGRYAPFTYPNWATKFFVEAMMTCQEWMK